MVQRCCLESQTDTHILVFPSSESLLVLFIYLFCKVPYQKLGIKALTGSEQVHLVD